MLPTIVYTTMMQETLTEDTKVKTYSLYKYYQNEKSSRGLITRTLNYYEFIIFCLKSNPITTYNTFYDWNKIEKKIDKTLQKIPLLSQTYIGTILIENDFFYKLYPFMIDYNLSFDKMVLYNVYEMLRVKNPNYTIWSIDDYKYNQPTWLHPPTKQLPQTIEEQTLYENTKQIIRLGYQIQELERLQEIYNHIDKNLVTNINKRFDELVTICIQLKEMIEYKLNKMEEYNDTYK